MGGTAKEYTYPLRLPLEDEPKISELVKSSEQSINSIPVLCIRKGLPLVRQVLGQDTVGGDGGGTTAGNGFGTDLCRKR